MGLREQRRKRAWKRGREGGSMNGLGEFKGLGAGLGGGRNS